MLQPRVLLARDDDLARAAAALDRVGGATGAAVVIEGPAGIGKTTLAERLVEHAANAGARVRLGAARELESDLPFAAIADLIGLDPRSDDPERARVGALLRGEGTLDATQRRWRVIDAAVGLVEQEAADAPLVLVLEDVHWADADTSAILSRLAGLLDHAAVGIVVTLRPDPSPAPVAGALRALRAVGAVEVALGALTQGEVVELAHALVGAEPDEALRAALSRAGGNPLYVVEVLAALRDEGALTVEDGIARLAGDSLPPSLRLTIVRRLGYLPAATVEVLRHAAVLGESAVVTRLAATLDRDPAAVLADLEPAFRSDLLARSGESVTFRHVLVRDALYDDLPGAMRTALHARAAEVLTAQGAPPGQVAVHLERSLATGDVATAERLLAAAGALVDTAPGRAEHHARQVLNALPESHPDRLRARTLLAQAAARTGHPEDAEHFVRDLDNSGLDVATRLELWHTVTLARHMRGEYSADALDAYGALLTASGFEGTQRHRHLALIGFADRWQRRDRCQQALDEAIAQATDDAARALALAGAAVVRLQTGDVGGARSSSLDSLAAVRRSGLEGTWIGVEAHAAAGLLGAVDPEQAVSVARDLTGAIATAEDAGLLYALPRLHVELARGAAFQGDFDTAVTLAQTALHAMDDTGYRDQADSALAILSLIALDRGQEELVDHYRAMVGEHPSMTSPVNPPFARARAALRRGDAAEVWDDLQDHARSIRDHDEPFLELVWSLPYVEAAVAVGAHEEATAWAAFLDDHAADVVSDPVRAVAASARAVVERTVESAEAAIAASRTTAVWPTRLDALRIAGPVLAENDRREEAVMVLKAGRQLADAAGATVVVARYDALLRGLGVRRGAVGGRSRPDRGWDALTEAELRVVELVADGLTYRAVGERLFISRRTVETHVANARRKLGAANRNELTRAYLGRPGST